MPAIATSRTTTTFFTLLVASCSAAALLHRPPLALAPHVPHRCRAVVCAESDAPDFDETLRGLLGEAEACGSMETAVDTWLTRLDDTFIPELGARITDMTEAGSPEVPQLNEVMATLQARSQDRFERARDQLQTLLGAGSRCR